MVDLSLPVRVCGREFSLEDLEVIRGFIAKDPPLCRAEIARRTCTALEWRTPAGELKAMSCRVALLRLQDRGLIDLPPPTRGNGNWTPYRTRATIAEPSVRIEGSVRRLPDLALRPVGDRRESRLWNEAVHRFHYLGYKPLPGAQMRYLVESQSGLLGVIGFGASAWKAAPRDRWIGWSAEQREARLSLVVNNARFLILPWVRSRNLASWVLSRCAGRIAADWEDRYGYRPVLMESFVERERFRGSCYKGANWVYVGDTQGRGKLDRYQRCALPIKQIYLYPLSRDFREVLTR